MLKVAEILTRRGMDAFFDVYFDGETFTYLRKEEPLLRESWRDGKFIVKTNTTLPAAEVVLSYKTLMRIEQTFRQIKNFLDVGSMYNGNERRVGIKKPSKRIMMGDTDHKSATPERESSQRDEQITLELCENEKGSMTDQP